MYNKLFHRLITAGTNIVLYNEGAVSYNKLFQVTTQILSTLTDEWANFSLGNRFV